MFKGFLFVLYMILVGFSSAFLKGFLFVLGFWLVLVFVVCFKKNSFLFVLRFWLVFVVCFFFVPRVLFLCLCVLVV